MSSITTKFDWPTCENSLEDHLVMRKKMMHHWKDQLYSPLSATEEAKKKKKSVFTDHT